MVDWKSRYAELIEHSEKRQKYFSRREHLLVSGFTSTLQLARGFSDALDTKLLATQRLLRQEDTKNVDLEQGVEALERSAIKALGERKEYLQDAGRNVRHISAQLRSLGVDVKIAHGLKQIEKSLKRDDVSFSRLLLALQDLRRLHKTGIKQDRSKQGFFARWRGSEPVVQAVVNEEQELETTQAVTEPGESGDSGVGEAKKPSILSTLNASFLSLLAQLARPDQTRAIENKLARGLNADEIPNALDEICDLGISAIQEERDAFHSSMNRLVARLNESANRVDSCRTVEQDNQHSTEALHKVVSLGLSDMAAVLEKAQDIETLREAVNLSLTEVNAALKTYQQQERSSAMNEALDRLAGQLAHMQDMSRASLFRVEEQIQLAHQDPETGLSTRVVLREQSSVLSQTEMLSIAVCRFNNDSVDLDALRALVEALKNIDGSAHSYRLGPNQFGVVLLGKNQQAAAVIMNNVRQAIGFKTDTSICIGIAAATVSDTIETVLARADKVSRTGKDQTNLAP